MAATGNVCDIDEKLKINRYNGLPRKRERQTNAEERDAHIVGVTEVVLFESLFV